MSLHVIEGTWEEIKRHEAELIGRQLRVTIKPEAPTLHKQTAKAKKPAASTEPKVLRGYGMLAGIVDSEEFLRRKHEETEIEDRPIS